MPTSRSIPSEAWVQARQALVFYFSRRHGLESAEDLAQETLAALWSRDDFEFAHEKDFLRVCYAFAQRVSKVGWRRQSRDTTVELNEEVGAKTARSNQAEMAVYLREVLDALRSEMSSRDRQLIVDGAAGTIGHSGPEEANRMRVGLCRARKRLAKLTGWPIRM